MSIVKRHLAEQEERLVLVEEICIDKGALVLDPITDEVFFSADEAAYKSAYVTVFQAWAKGTIKGTAEQVFDASERCNELSPTTCRVGDITCAAASPAAGAPMRTPEFRAVPGIALWEAKIKFASISEGSRVEQFTARLARSRGFCPMNGARTFV